MSKIDEIKKKLAEFVPVMDGLSRARNPFELRYFVIGKHDDRVQQYKQAVVEMDAKYKSIEEAVYGNKLKEIERERLLIGIIESPKNRLEHLINEEIDIKVARMDEQKHDSLIAMTGAMKEVMDFITIIENEYSDLVDKTEEELLTKEKEYWVGRLSKQAHIDFMTAGQISASNLSSIQCMPKDIQEDVMKQAILRTQEFRQFGLLVENKASLKLAESYPHATTFIAPPNYTPLKLLKDAPEGYPQDRIVKMDRVEIMIATLHRPNDTEWISEKFWIPTGKNYIKHWVTCDDPQMIGEWRNRIVKDALSLGCEHLFFVDDDLIVEQDALQKLYAHKLDVVGGWYVKKTPAIESATMISEEVGESKRPVPLDSKGLIKADWSLTAGLTLLNMNVFRKINYPYYLTTDRGTEDTYLTARLKEAGIDSWLDTDVKAGHVDKKTRDIYTLSGIVKQTT